MNVKQFDTKQAFEDLHLEWNALVKRSITDTPFSTHEWHQHWWEVYHPGTLWLITFRDEQETLQGIAPLFISQETQADGTTRRVLRVVGCVDVTDYVDLIISQSHAAAVYTALATFLTEHSDRFDIIDWCNIPSASQTYTQFPQYLADQGFTVQTQQQEVCPLIPLPDTFDDYLALLDKKQTKELQRKLRRAKGAGESLNWYIVDETHDLEAETEKFLTLMAASHPDKATFLQNQQHVLFFKSIIPAAMQAGWLQMNILEVLDEPIAAYVNFDYNNNILVYNSGLDPQKAAALSPGIVCLCYNIQHAIENHRDTFNFLRGDEQYKYKMGGQDTAIFNLIATRP